MPDIKLKNNLGEDITYENVDIITVPLADGSDTWTFGVTDEDLTFTGSMEYGFSGNKFKWLVDKYIDRMDFTGVTSANYMFSSTSYEELPDLTFGTLSSATYIFQNSKLKTLPYIYADEILFSNQILISMPELRNIPTDWIDNLNFVARIGSSTAAANMSGHIASLGSLRNTDGSVDAYNAYYDNELNTLLLSSLDNMSYQNSLVSCYVLDGIDNWPILNAATLTANRFSSMFSNVYRLKDFKFITDNGTSRTVRWKNQLIDMSLSNIGWCNTSPTSTGLITDHNTGITADKNIFTSTTMTQAEMEARYNSLKDDLDWFSATNQQISYGGANRYAGLLFSRFNHDSAVNTINSLPDASEYLATAGGTNTIKFNGYSGALTDGGAINTLTPEEIAVATAKGWTVTIV